MTEDDGGRSTSASADAEEQSPEDVFGREAAVVAGKNDPSPPSVSGSLQSSKTVRRLD